MNSIKVNRLTDNGFYKLEEIFENLKNSSVLLDIFKSKQTIDDVFTNTRVIVDGSSQYMYVNNEDASIVIGSSHLKNSDKKILYLDIIHELVHVRQQREGFDLYDKSYAYVDRPTEIEAYLIAVQEAKRLGMKDDEIYDYLHVDWITKEEHDRLAASVGIQV